MPTTTMKPVAEAVRQRKLIQDIGLDHTFDLKPFDSGWGARRMSVDEALESAVALDALVSALKRHGFLEGAQ